MLDHLIFLDNLIVPAGGGARANPLHAPWLFADLTGHLYCLVLESQLPYKIVHSVFTITNYNIKFIVLWGS